MVNRQPNVEIRLSEGSIDTIFAFPPTSIQDAGAVLTFRGVVRSTEPPSAGGREPEEDGEQSIEGLEYQIYEPMTSRELERLAVDQCRRHGVLAMDVQHSSGFVAGGQCSFVLQVASRHREEGIRCVDEFIAEMKRQVPIWKVPRWRPISIV